METQYNNITKDIKTKQALKIKCIYDFITSKKTVNEFVKEYDEAFSFVFTDFRKFFIENYRHCFSSANAFIEFLKEKDFKRGVKTEIKNNKDFVIKKTKLQLKKTLPAAIKKWRLFEQKEKEIYDTFLYYAKQGETTRNKDLRDFLHSLNMNRCNYYNARSSFIRNGVMTNQTRDYVKKHKFMNPNLREKRELTKKQKENLLIKRNKAIEVVKMYLKGFFEGKIKTIETIKALEVLGIPVNASISEISKYLD